MNPTVRILAEKLMGWKLISGLWHYHSDGDATRTSSWVNMFLKEDDYDPTAPTEKGLFQCLGKGGVVEVMEKKGWKVDKINQVGGMWWCRFIKKGRKIEDMGTTITEACCEAARAALTK